MKLAMVLRFGFWITFMLVAPLCGRAQGPLAPSGAPAPTMKTLDQVEARIPIMSVPCSITQSGSYYLTTNLTCATVATNGIYISASYVTLDLNGFTLNGPGSSSGHGIYGTGSSIQILNGCLRNWQGGGKYAIYISSGEAIIKNIIARSSSSGIYLGGNDGLVANCLAANLGDSASDTYGIYVYHGCMVVDSSCHAFNGSGSTYGIRTLEDCSVQNCSIWDVDSGSTNGSGIYAGHGSQVINCIVNYNELSAGIYAGNACQIMNNQVRDNGFNGGQAAGIYITGKHNRLQGNHIVNNYYGLRFGVSGLTNLIVNNTIMGNDISVSGLDTANNHVGPMDSNIGTPTNHPWANFVF